MSARKSKKACCNGKVVVVLGNLELCSGHQTMQLKANCAGISFSFFLFCKF